MGSLDAIGTPANLTIKGLNNIPGVHSDLQVKPGTFLTKLYPRFKDTIDGKYGELAKQRLEAQLSFAEYWAFTTGGLAAMGNITGNNPPDGMPKNSFIIGDPKGKYTAVSYDRIVPINVPMSLIADLVTSLKSGALSQQQYDKGLSQLVASLGISTLDQSFMLGLQNSTRLLDIKNYTENSIGRSFVSLLSTGGSQVVGGAGGLARLAGSWANPYKSVDRVDGDMIATFLLQLRQQTLGGYTNPPLYDPLTGQPELKTQISNSQDYWTSSFLGSRIRSSLCI